MQAIPNEEASSGGGDVARYVEAATEAARRGDLADLERNLGKIRSVAPERAAEIDERLTKLAGCVRAHPSFTGSAANRAAS